MIIRRVDVVDELEDATVEKDVTEEYPEEYADTSDRLEDVRESGVPSPSPASVVESNDLFVLIERFLSRDPGGTSCTWRFNGWFDLEGGGRTTMNDSFVRSFFFLTPSSSVPISWLFLSSGGESDLGGGLGGVSFDA